jgi:vitamin B12 transporter
MLFPLFSQEASEGEEDFFGEDLLLMEGEGITVTASPETTQQMKVVTKEEIENAHAPDLAALLQETLDLGVTRYGPYGSQADINMRGFDSERIAFLIDGVPANSPMSGEFDLSMIDLNAVERIELVYGGSDSKYNVTGALGGVINIITTKKQAPGLRLGGALSNTSVLPGKYFERSGEKAGPAWQDLADTQNAVFSLALGLEKLSVSGNIFANRAENHFLFTDNNKIIRRKDNNEIWDTGLSTSFIWDLPDYAKLIAGGDFYYGDKRIPSSGFSSIAEIHKDFSSRQNLMLDMPVAFRDDLSSEASLTHAWSTLNYGPADSGAADSADASHHRQHTITAINRWHWYAFSKLSLRLGGDYRYSYLDSAAMGVHGRHDGGIYLTGEYQPVKQLLFIPSVKAVFSGSRTAPVTAVPKLGFLWQPSDSFSFKNNYFRSFKIPDFEDLYWAEGGMYGNPDLKPEDGWGTDLGAAWRINDWVNIEGVFFTQWTADSIHWYSSGGTLRPTNVGEAIFFGLDSKLRFEIPLPKLPFPKIGFSLSYQYLLSYLLSYGYDYGSDKRIPYIPGHAAGFSVDLPWKTGSFSVSGHYEGPRYADTANLTKLKHYFLLNAHVSQKIGKNFTAFVIFRNILNQSYESFDDYYMPGLTMTAGIRMNFEMSGRNENR